MSTLAIIGTAGRREDASRLTLPVWNQMKRLIHRFVMEHGFTDLISGASAFADHLAVGLYNAGFAKSLTLAIPCHFNWEDARFVHGTEPYNPAARLNELHAHFSAVIGKPSLQEIKTAMYSAKVVQSIGFHARNDVVAERATHVIAFTFGNGPELADGGTAYTARKYLARGGKHLWHVDLNDMSLHENGTVS